MTEDDDTAAAQLRTRFSREVERLLAAAEHSAGMAVTRTAGAGPRGGRWVATPSAAEGLVVTIELGPESVEVRLSVGGLVWSNVEVLETGATVGAQEMREEALSGALDLAAAGLWGGARALVDSRGDGPVAMQVQFGARSRFITHATVTKSRRVLERLAALLAARAPATIHANAVPPPKRHKCGEAGRNPLVPWAGVYGTLGAQSTPVTVPVDGVLDLHTFKPKQVSPVVLAYIAECSSLGIRELRLIHGKGIGNLRRTVHALLAKHEDVAEYRLGGHGEGSWGATIVTLKERSE